MDGGRARAELAETPCLWAVGPARVGVIGVATVVDTNNLPSPSSFPFLNLPTLSSVPPPPPPVFPLPLLLFLLLGSRLWAVLAKLLTNKLHLSLPNHGNMEGSLH